VVIKRKKLTEIYKTIMKNLYKIEWNTNTNIYYLSYDFAGKKKEELAIFLSENDILAKNVEFQVYNKDGKCNTNETLYVIKPAETTIIFASDKSISEIINILNVNSNIDFVLSQLQKGESQLEAIIINNYAHGQVANDEIRKKIETKEQEQTQVQKEFYKLSNYPPKSKIIIRVQQI